MLNSSYLRFTPVIYVLNEVIILISGTLVETFLNSSLIESISREEIREHQCNCYSEYIAVVCFSAKQCKWKI